MYPWIKLYKEKKSSALEKAKESGVEEIIEIIRSRGAGIDECFKISKFKNKKDLVAGIGKRFPSVVTTKQLNLVAGKVSEF